MKVQEFIRSRLGLNRCTSRSWQGPQGHMLPQGGRCRGHRPTDPATIPADQGPAQEQKDSGSQGSPSSASGKEPTCQRRRRKRSGFHPWVGKIPWRRRWQSTPEFLPGKSLGQRSLAGCCPQGRGELNVTEATQHTCTRTRNRQCPLGRLTRWSPDPSLKPTFTSESFRSEVEASFDCDGSKARSRHFQHPHPGHSPKWLLSRPHTAVVKPRSQSHLICLVVFYFPTALRYHSHTIQLIHGNHTR